MSAARVLNPMINEIYKISTSSPAAMRSNLTCGRQLNRIKRDLFGPANPIETNKIFKEELEKYQERATKKWGFDFRNGSPLNSNSQFIWERVSAQESVVAPEMYTLTRAAHVRPTVAAPTSMELMMDERANRDLMLDENANRENLNLSQNSVTDTDSCDESLDESVAMSTMSSMVVFKVPAGPNHAETTLCVPRNRSFMRKRQPKITEYLKERKRLAQTAKKISTPAKRMRTISGSSHPMVNHHTIKPNSIAAHFALRSRHN